MREQNKKRKRQRLTYAHGLLTLPNGTSIFVSEFEPLVVKERFCIRVTDRRCDPPRSVLLKTTNAIAFYRKYDPARGRQLMEAVATAKMVSLARQLRQAEERKRPGPSSGLTDAATTIE